MKTAMVDRLAMLYVKQLPNQQPKTSKTDIASYFTWNMASKKHAQVFSMFKFQTLNNVFKFYNHGVAN